MIQNELQILESIRSLAPEKRERVIRAAIIENDERTWKSSDSKQDLANRSARFKKAQEWIHAHKEEYNGQFVLLEGDQLIGNGTDPKELYKLADERGIKSPFVKRIKAFELPFGGW